MYVIQKRPTVVLDFDGTLTDVWKEALPFSSVYKEKLRKFLDISHDQLEKRFSDAVKTIRANPGKYGWENNGLIVAPATVDPYILHRSVAKLLIALTSEQLDQMFTESYQHTDTIFRPSAKRLLSFLRDTGTCIIVTNSDPQIIEKKLITLLGKNHGLSIRGFAKKYDLDPTWNEVPETIQPKGFPRPVYLRRKAYGNILQRIGHVDLVIGDIYDLDLALPEALGIPTILIATKETPLWETAYYKRHPTGVAVTNLDDIFAKRYLN